MKTRAQNCILRFQRRCWGICLILSLFSILHISDAQAAIIIFGSVVGDGHISMKTYQENGFKFQVAARPDNVLYHDLFIIGDQVTSTPHNGTANLLFQGSISFSNYVVITQTSGDTFGLASVDLGAVTAPSYSSKTIEFNGYKMDGSIVTNSFNTAGGGITTFENFTFSTEFSSGLTRVEIPSLAWSMDNMVIVPEPGTVTLFVIGLGAYAGWCWRKRRG